MKKVIITLISVFISFSSYGETIFCSGMLGEQSQLLTFKRVGNGFQSTRTYSSPGYDIDYVYETEEYLVLQDYYDDGIGTLRIFKKHPRKFHYVHIAPDGLVEIKGDCKFID